jgi:hypothetical protein
MKWIKEIIAKGFKTVNMLGCHDGIPVLDLKGKEVNGVYQKGLLEDKKKIRFDRAHYCSWWSSKKPLWSRW